jgi:hypothetical protein
MSEDTPIGIRQEFFNTLATNNSKASRTKDWKGGSLFKGMHELGLVGTIDAIEKICDYFSKDSEDPMPNEIKFVFYIRT